MRVVERKAVPIYEVTCFECKSRIQYRASEVAWHHITCPVCGVSLWADAVHPVKTEEVTECHCDRNLCATMEINGKGCEDCPAYGGKVTK